MKISVIAGIYLISENCTLIYLFTQDKAVTRSYTFYNGTGTFVILIVDLRLLTLFHIKKPDVNLQNLSLCYSGNKTKLTNDTHDSDPRTITHDTRTIAHDTHLDMMHERLLT